MIRFQKILLPAAFLLFTAISFSCKKSSGTTGDGGGTPTSSSPNVIFIVADDMGWDVFGKYPGINGTKPKTPTLDSLAANGITFTNYWVNPECSPTRAAMLTGKCGFRTGVGGVATPQTAFLQSSEKIIHKYINEKTSNAYATALIGKWHVTGNTQLSAPETFGVQYFTGFLPGAITDYYNWTQTSNGAQQNVTTYATTQFVNQSVSWIQQQSKPFFLWLALNAPHSPFHRPPLNLITDQTLVDNQAAINANPFPYYLASIEAMDKEIGRLVGALTAAQKENTVFVFMGDNGTPGQVAQSPFSSTKAKSTLFQGGVNTPLIVCGKNVTRKNITETALVQAPDMFTTFADITGAGSANYQDGISIKPLLASATAAKRTFAYSELFGSAPSTAFDGYAIRNEHYKLIRLISGTEYLYKLSTDPFEQTNLMAAPLTAEAQQNLDQLRQIKAGL
jgi:arylsulfatase B